MAQTKFIVIMAIYLIAIIYENDQQDATVQDNCSLAALQVSSDIFAHHQEHLNFIYSFWYYTRMSLSAGVMGELELTEVSSNSPMTPAGNDIRV